MTGMPPARLEAREAAASAAGSATAEAIGARLQSIYAEIAERSMRDLPIYNPALEVAAIGFREDAGRVVGVLTTPWFMNLVVTRAPEGPDLPFAPAGSAVGHGFPGGEIECVVGETTGFGRLDSASLFSPMFQFDDPVVVRAAAEAALEAVFQAPEDAEPVAPPPPPRERALDRRALLFGRRRDGEDPTCR